MMDDRWLLRFFELDDLYYRTSEKNSGYLRLFQREQEQDRISQQRIINEKREEESKTIYKILLKIDNGYEPSKYERLIIENVKCLYWHDIQRLPLCIGLLSNITYLDLSDNSIEDFSVLASLKQLNILDLSHTNIKDLSVLSSMVNLLNLNLSRTQVHDLKPLKNLVRLMTLDISFTEVTDISPLSHQRRLTELDLRSLKLAAIPEFLLELRLEFTFSSVRNGPGIYINNVKLVEQPIEIFKQSRNFIRAYYDDHTVVLVNECKVIFLGDAEAGKTHSIKRLLNNGGYLQNFDGNSTPGIEITVSSTKIEDSDIVVNYWDFGGQEIQHSMHRMFLTERTVYVVFLNARQDPLDERARYWLENINSYAPGAPVLLVINKIDQNDCPKFNEGGITTLYKEQIKKVIRMSALKDEPEMFLKKLKGSIDTVIKELPTVNTKIPKSWKSLMENIRIMPNHYMTTDEFQNRCKEFNVSDYKSIHDDLVDLFQVIGVSFCYYKNRSTADYLILNPKWLVNAIYTIVTNSETVINNGVITQKDLYDLLQEDKLQDDIPIKRVLPNIRYKGIEINYILGVIRMFRLSYQLKNGSEFFPMLCDGNEKIKLDEVVSANALHYIYRYIYLPANVLHRLIVDMQTDIDYRYVWYSGAYFCNKIQNQVAYVYFEGNELHIYVESRDAFYNPNEYLSEFLKHVREINREMGLSAKEYVTYREGNKETEISFKKLKGKLVHGLLTDYDEVLDKVIDYRVVAHRYEYRFPIIKGEILQKIVESLEAMQNERMCYRNSDNSHELEDFRNRFVSNFLRGAGYNCSDQQTVGVSLNKKQTGKRDILIRDINNRELLIYEGVNLEYVDKADISKHLEKLLVNYNPQGLPYGILTTYLECDRKSFRGFVERYKSYIKKVAPDSFESLGEPIELRMHEGQFLSCIEMSYGCKDTFFVIYHIVTRVAP